MVSQTQQALDSGVLAAVPSLRSNEICEGCLYATSIKCIDHSAAVVNVCHNACQRFTGDLRISIDVACLLLEQKRQASLRSSTVTIRKIVWTIKATRSELLALLQDRVEERERYQQSPSRWPLREVIPCTSATSAGVVVAQPSRQSEVVKGLEETCTNPLRGLIRNLQALMKELNGQPSRSKRAGKEQSESVLHHQIWALQRSRDKAVQDRHPRFRQVTVLQQHPKPTLHTVIDHAACFLPLTTSKRHSAKRSCAAQDFRRLFSKLQCWIRA
mmetsp:Transcript_44323/g.82439  ORF Transcript_44323/g.82439 Transcript_44323/m.82439 type:complete len:272 (-) Transcript_44323:174-989(-)